MRIIESVEANHATRIGVQWFLATGKKYPCTATLLLIAIGVGCRIALSPLIDDLRAPFLTGWPTCLIVALLCGRLYGLVTVAFFGLFGWFMYLDTPFTITHVSEVASTTNLAVFTFTAGFSVLAITWLCNTREHYELIARELKHRSNNLISVIQAIVTKTVTNGNEQDILNGRLSAIARADQLVSAQSDHARIAELIHDAVSPFMDAQIQIDVEPDLFAEARTALYLRLLFHEWATNSTKHGALRPCQRVHALITVSLRRNDHEICIRWIESSVNKIKPTQSNGFGTTLAQQLARTLRGISTSDLTSDGIHCEIRFHPSYVIQK